MVTILVGGGEGEEGLSKAWNVPESALLTILLNNQ